MSDGQEDSTARYRVVGGQTGQPDQPELNHQSGPKPKPVIEARSSAGAWPAQSSAE